jgi:type I restriction enzyme S subunit
MSRLDDFAIPKTRVLKKFTPWKKIELGNYLSFKNGINADKESYGTGYKFINVLDIINNNYIKHDEIIGSVNVDEKTFLKNEVTFGDILFQRSSEVREEAGQSSVYLDENKSATFGGFVIRGKPQKDYNPVYLNYLLKSWLARKEIVRKSGGSTRYNVGQDSLSTVELFTTDCAEEQCYIAQIISSVDKKISQLNTKSYLLKQYKKSIVQRIFSRELRFRDEMGNNFPNWKEKTLSQILDAQIRETPKPEEKYLALGIRSHMKGTFQKPNFDPKKIAMDKLYIVRPNDLVVNITFAWEGAVAIAKNIDDGGLVSHRFPTYIFRSGESNHKFFRHVIALERFKYLLGVISPGGAGRNRVLSKKDFLKLKWDFPCFDEQLKIADFLDEIDKKINLVANQIEQSKTYKKGLLQQLFV